VVLNLTYINFTKSRTDLGELGRLGQLGSVTGPSVQADRARDELGPGWDLYTLISRPAFRSTGPKPGMSSARDDRGLQILSRSRDEKYWGLNFGSLHTRVGAVINEG
jgi:hypothetical protein